MDLYDINKTNVFTILKLKTSHSKLVVFFAFPGLVITPTVLCLSLLFFGETVEFFVSFAFSASIFTLCIVLVVEMFTCESVEDHFDFEMRRFESSEGR